MEHFHRKAENFALMAVDCVPVGYVIVLFSLILAQMFNFKHPIVTKLLTCIILYLITVTVVFLRCDNQSIANTFLKSFLISLLYICMCVIGEVLSRVGNPVIKLIGMLLSSGIVWVAVGFFYQWLLNYMFPFNKC